MATGSLGTLSVDVIGSIAELVSDLGRAQQENAKAARAMQRQWEDFGHGVTDTVKELAASLGAAFSVGAIVEFGKSIVEANSHLADMAQSVGVSAQSLSEYSVAAKLAGANIDDVGQGLAKLARASNDAAHGSQASVAAFQAIGVSVRDASGHLKSTELLFDEVSVKFANLKEGAGKTALAMQFFGKSGANLIPLMNEWGASVDSARVKAQELGLAISNSEATAFKRLDDTVTEVGLAIRGDFTQALTVLLPYLQDAADYALDLAKNAGTMKEQLYEAITVINQAKDALSDLGVELQTDTENTPFITGILNGMQNDMDAFARMKQSFKDLAADLQLGLQFKVGGGLPDQSAIDEWNAALDRNQAATDAAVASNHRWSDSVTQSGSVLTSLSDAVKTVSGTIKDGKLSADQYAKAMSVIGKLGEDAAKQGADQAQVARIIDAAYRDLGNTFEKSGRQASDGFDKAGNSAKAAKIPTDQLGDAERKFLDIIGKIAGAMSPAAKAQSDFEKSMRDLAKSAEDFSIQGADVTKIIPLWQKAESQLADQLADTNEELRKRGDILGVLQTDYANQTAQLFMTDREKAIADAVDKATASFEKNTKAGVDNLKTLEEVQAGAKAMAGQFYDVSKAVEAQKKANDEFVAIFVNASKQIGELFGQLFTGQIKGWKDFGSQLVNIAKQMVAQIISQFIQLRILGPILSGVFGGAGGGGGFSLASLGMSAISGGGGTGIAGGLTGGASGGTGIGSFFQGGQSMWAGFENGFSSSSTASSNMFGTYTPDYGAGTYAPSALGYGVAAAGGIYAGYNRYQQSGGGVAGLAGAAAYGYGTYAATIGTGAALSGGLAAGAAAIPVVGWIALAAMLIDKFSGGKLFGTKGEVQSGVSTLSIGAGGADYSTFLALKGQSALFGGAKWSTENVAQTPEEKAAAQAFFDSMTQTMAQYAEQFGADAGQLVAAKYGQQFDKHGNPTGVTSATIAGHEYANLKPEEFQQAYISANELAILSQFDSGLNATIEQYRASVDQLNAIAAGLSQAQAMFQAGGQFLSIAGDQTLSAVVHLAEGVQQAGETIGDTIARLVQAQAQYDQFVAQFKPAATYTSAFEQALVSIHSQMLANANQANALARAAGAEHASEQDLINIHNLAAQQFAAAVAQLQANANSLAASLGYAMPQSLDQINARIAELQGQANSGASAIGNFSNAMSAAAQSAQEAMNLLLGDLSPLNDQQKLQTALEGLRAGTASAEQVLQIGRQLYATGSDYNALFARVMAMARGGVQATNQGGGGGGAGQTGNSQELSDLIAQRDAILAAQQHVDALQLAQMVADLAASSGQSIQDALTQIGITDLGPFMQELGIANEADFEKFIQGLEDQTDSAGDNTATLSDDIQSGNEVLVNILAVLQQIASASGGPAGTPISFGDAGDLSTAMRDLASTMRDRNFTRGRGDRESTNFSRVR